MDKKLKKRYANKVLLNLNYILIKVIKFKFKDLKLVCFIFKNSFRYVCHIMNMGKLCGVYTIWINIAVCIALEYSMFP